jgi:hypothetical protein
MPLHKVWSAERLSRSIVTRARVPRPGGRVAQLDDHALRMSMERVRAECAQQLVSRRPPGHRSLRCSGVLEGSSKSNAFSLSLSLCLSLSLFLSLCRSLFLCLSASVPLSIFFAGAASSSHSGDGREQRELTARWLPGGGGPSRRAAAPHAHAAGRGGACARRWRDRHGRGRGARPELPGCPRG